MLINKTSLLKVSDESNLPDWASRSTIATFLHETMKPYEDTVEDIHRGLDYAFSTNEGRGGFLILAHHESSLDGVLVLLKTGMKGYIPENLILFVSIAPDLRGAGLGRQLIEFALRECEGSVKLHVEYDNPAKRLYERMGFINKYAEMRLIR